jgi:hypothetical protein
MKVSAGEQIAEFVLRYLLENPEAEDTLDGIVEWWLMRQRIQYETTRVKKALTELADQGFILERRSPGTQARYRINRRKIRTIRGYLQRKEKA